MPLVGGCKRSKTGSVLEGTSAGAADPATVCPKALPTPFYGKWIEFSYGEKESSGTLVIDADHIDWTGTSPVEKFSVNCAAVKVGADGALSFTPSMMYYSGSFGRFFTVSPTVKVSRRDPDLLLDVGAFRAEIGGPGPGGALESIDPHQYMFAASR
jgi:hypothetical protein